MLPLLDKLGFPSDEESRRVSGFLIFRSGSMVYGLVRVHGFNDFQVWAVFSEVYGMYGLRVASFLLSFRKRAS